MGVVSQGKVAQKRAKRCHPPTMILACSWEMTFRMNLRLLQLGDSALPIGGYSHSWGLEAAIERGLVRDAAGLEQWTRCWLRHAVGPFEGVVIGAVCRAAAEDDWSAVRQANDFIRVGLTPATLRN